VNVFQTPAKKVEMVDIVQEELELSAASSSIEGQDMTVEFKSLVSNVDSSHRVNDSGPVIRDSGLSSQLMKIEEEGDLRI
jgi:hypothetical protein